MKCQIEYFSDGNFKVLIREKGKKLKKMRKECDNPKKPKTNILKNKDKNKFYHQYRR